MTETVDKKRFAGWRVLASLFVLALVAQVVVPALLSHASAAGFQKVLVRFDRMNANQATTGLICVTPGTTSANVKTWAVTFPTGYTVSTTAANWQTTNISTTGIPAGTTAWPNATAATAGVVGQTVTWTNTAVQTMNAGTQYCYYWTSSAALSITASASNNNTGSVTTKDNGAATIDSGSFATASVANTCGSGTQACDQIQVSASVNPSFSFALSATTSALGLLSSAGPTAGSAINATVSTNAAHGWQMWAADLAGTPGLVSAAAGKTISYSPAAGSAASALTNGAEGYNLGAGTASGTTCTSITDDTNFASAGTSFKGGGLDNTLRSLATSTGIANACSLPLTVNAEISATTPAASDYASTVTVVAAGNF